MLMPRLRPALSLTCEGDPESLAARVQDRLAEAGAPCRGRAVVDQIELQIRASDKRFWSPTLNVLVTPTERGCALRCVFGPNPDVWTLFLACYAFVILSAVFGAFYGLAQWTLGAQPYALLSIPIALALLIGIYIAAGVGQRLGRDQVEVLESFLMECVGATGQSLEEQAD